MNEHAQSAIYVIYTIGRNIAWLSSSPPAQLRAMVFTDVLGGSSVRCACGSGVWLSTLKVLYM